MFVEKTFKPYIVQSDNETEFKNHNTIAYYKKKTA